jgi:hypothetical protein
VTAQAIIDANRYMTLATADEHGEPWATPVWYATVDAREFFWVSRPEARHSRNIATRPEVAIVIFNSQVPVGGAEALYVEALAEELEGDEIERGMGVFSQVSEAQGLSTWTVADVQEPAHLRAYRAMASDWSLLGPGDLRVPIRP